MNFNFNLKALNKKSFTLMELLVVIILIAIIAAFAIPDYSKSLRKMQVKHMVSQLSILHAANIHFSTYYDHYCDGDPALTLADINTNLNINLISNGETYTYDTTGDTDADKPTTYVASAAYGSDYTLKMRELPVSIDQAAAVGNENPCCGAGNCASISNLIKVCSW